jgi:hypothetical protein
MFCKTALRRFQHQVVVQPGAGSEFGAPVRSDNKSMTLFLALTGLSTVAFFIGGFNRKKQPNDYMLTDYYVAKLCMNSGFRRIDARSQKA